jgi:poly-gamma-glutamate synthesis protein (capsule biosynthesis protein)
MIIPHHLLVAPLIAEGFSRLKGHRYDRIVILSPDHFWRSKSPFSVPNRDFQTCLGPACIDRKAIEKLLENPSVKVSNLFSHEHGIQALLPFIVRYFPDTPLVPVVLRPSAGKDFWEPLAQTLDPVITSQTLIVQSTDFSHYLPFPEAKKRDQESLRIIALNEPGQVFSLRQPANIDSVAALFFQTSLQNRLFKANPVVLDNRNSWEVFPTPKTTSYMHVLYSSENIVISGDRPARFASQPITRTWSGSECPGTKPDTFSFFGDTFFGRFAEKLVKRKQEEVISHLRNHLGTTRTILNLEGVFSPPPVDRLPKLRLYMDPTLAISLLKSVNVEAVALANNHSRDFGPGRLDATKTALAAAGIIPLMHGSIEDFGPFRLVTFSDIDNYSNRFDGNIATADLKLLETCSRDKPLFAFLHWGREWETAPGRREHELMDELQRRGVELLIGAHSHTTSPLRGDKDFLYVYSLGNFFFDQLKPRAGGAALDIRFFPQGTYFLHRRLLGNVFQECVKTPRREASGPKGSGRIPHP